MLKPLMGSTSSTTQEKKTVTTLLAQKAGQPFTDQDVLRTAEQGMAAAREHEGVAKETMLKAKQLHDQSNQDRTTFRAQQQEAIAAQKDKGTLMMREAAAKVDANQNAYREYNQTVGSEEWSTGRTMLMKQMAERTQDLATAQQDLQKGGILDSIGAAFRVAYHQQRLAEISQSVQQVQATEMQAGQQLLMNLQKNAAAVGDIYAVEKQQNVNRAELAATLMKMSADGVQLNRDSMTELASILGISSDLANSKMKDFNIIIAANNASSSIFQTKLQEVQAEQAQLNLDRTKKLYTEEKERDENIEAKWQRFVQIQGIKNPGTFKEAEQVAAATKQPSPTLVQFGLYLGSNKEKFSLTEAVLASKGNGPLTDDQKWVLQRGDLAKRYIDNETFAENKRKAEERYPIPLIDGKPAATDPNAKARAQLEAELNAQSAMSYDNPTHLGKIEQRVKEMENAYQADIGKAYNDGVVVDSPVEDVNYLVKTAGPARDLLQSTLSPEVFAKLEKGEFGEISTVVDAGKDAGANIFAKMTYAVDEASKSSLATVDVGTAPAQTVDSMKARIREQAQVIAAGWKVKSIASGDYRNQNFTSAKVMVPVPDAEGKASSELMEIDMTNPSAVYYYMEQISKKKLMDMYGSSALRSRLKERQSF